MKQVCRWRVYKSRKSNWPDDKIKNFTRRFKIDKVTCVDRTTKVKRTRWIRSMK